MTGLKKRKEASKTVPLTSGSAGSTDLNGGWVASSVGKVVRGRAHQRRLQKHGNTRHARKGDLGSVDDVFTEQVGGLFTRRSSLCSAVQRAVTEKPFCTSASDAHGSSTAKSGRRGLLLRDSS